MGWGICQQLKMNKEKQQNLGQVTKLPVRTSTIKAGKLLWTLAYNSRTSRNSLSNQQQSYKQFEMLAKNEGKNQIFLIKNIQK